LKETAMICTFRHLIANEEGQDLVEYILIAAFIAVVCWVAIQTTGLAVSDLWAVIESTTEAAAGAL
jgi:Flp pilus assembly pilin Flp